MSSRQQQHQQQDSPSKQVAPNAAKAVQYVCRMLRSYGIDTLTPELVRQAKFDAPEVSWIPTGLISSHITDICLHT
jgi:hypothetical protein